MPITLPHNQLAFAMQVDSQGHDFNYFLAVVDLNKMEIIQTIPRPHRYQYLTHDASNGIVYLSQTMADDQLSYDIDRFSLKTGKFLAKLKTKHHGPTQIMPISKEEIVVVEGSDGPSDELSIRKYNINLKLLKQEHTFTDRGDSVVGIVESEKNKILFAQNEQNTKVVGDVIVKNDKVQLHEIDIKNLSILTTKEVTKHADISILSAMAFNPKQKLVYLGPYVINVKTRKEEINTSVHVFSYPDFKFKFKIDTLGKPKMYRYVPHVNKLYVSHYKGFSVIDCNTHKVIKHFPFASFQMEYVGQDILLISRMGLDWEQVPGYTENGGWKAKHVQSSLLFFNVKTDTIIKELPGNFGPISKRYDL